MIETVIIFCIIINICWNTQPIKLKLLLICC
jgi:hypothetical protein